MILCAMSIDRWLSEAEREATAWQMHNSPKENHENLTRIASAAAVAASAATSLGIVVVLPMASCRGVKGVEAGVGSFVVI